MAKCRCKQCKYYFPKDSMITPPAGRFCGIDCAMAFVKEKQFHEKVKPYRKKVAKKVKSRNDWLDQLQDLVNQWIIHVRDKGKPCYTCGTTNPNIKYDAGHWLSRGAHKELRFEPTNIHKQCSIKCNVHGSGMRLEYEKHLIEDYGQDHVDWLTGPHKLLKDQYPDIESIKKEIIRYRQLIRAAGIVPYK